MQLFLSSILFIPADQVSSTGISPHATLEIKWVRGWLAALLEGREQRLSLTDAYLHPFNSA
jgi:hypothetical protein